MTSTALRDLIHEEMQGFEATPAKVARKLGVPTYVVRQVLSPEPPPGKINLADHIVATRRFFDEWDNDDPGIVEARQAYDDGNVEMCTGRDEARGLFVLYAIPRRRPIDRKCPYFSFHLGEE